MEELLAKYFAGEVSEEEKKQVEEWRGMSEDNARAFLAYKQTWVSSQPLEQPNQVMLNEILGDEDPGMSEDGNARIVPIWQQRPFQVAASVVVLIGVLFYLLKPNYEDQPWGEVLAERTIFDLPDGSEVTVEMGGSLVMSEFAETREIKLTGKAYFDVARDESKPFIIHTEGAEVRVLGTSFLVNTDEENLVTEVMVESGLVALGQNDKYFNGNLMEIQLKNGEMGILAVGERGIKKKKISDVNYLAWQNKVLTFNRTRMNQVGELLQDVYGLDVTFENSGLRGCYLTAKYNKKSPEEVVKLIAETFNMTYELKGKKVTFKGDGCQ